MKLTCFLSFRKPIINKYKRNTLPRRPNQNTEYIRAVTSVHKLTTASELKKTMSTCWRLPMPSSGWQVPGWTETHLCVGRYCTYAICIGLRLPTYSEYSRWAECFERLICSNLIFNLQWSLTHVCYVLNAHLSRLKWFSYSILRKVVTWAIV